MKLKSLRLLLCLALILCMVMPSTYAVGNEDNTARVMRATEEVRLQAQDKTRAGELCYGIDVSKWQGNINWQQVITEKQFAIMRCGKTYAATLTREGDENFETYYTNAKAVGMPIGAYYYSCACSYEEGVEDANYVLNFVRGKQFEYPIYLDVEDNTYQGTTAPENVVAAIRGYCETMAAAGYMPGIYANLYWFNTRLNDPSISQYAHWVAQWNVESCEYTGDFGLWQYSSTGSVSGINANVDLDAAYVDYPTIIKNAGLNGFGSGGEVGQNPPNVVIAGSSSSYFYPGNAITVNWGAVTGATSYNYNVQALNGEPAWNSSGNDSVLAELANASGTTATSFSITSAQTLQYESRWLKIRVASVFSDGTVMWANTRYIRLNPIAPTLTSHAANGQLTPNQQTTIRWQPSIGADSYFYKVLRLSGEPDPGSSGEAYEDQMMATVTTNTLDLPASFVQPNRYYKVYVVTYDYNVFNGNTGSNMNLQTSAVTYLHATTASVPTPTQQVPTPTPTQQVPTPTPTQQVPTPTPTQQVPTPTPTQQVPTPTPTQQVPTPTPTQTPIPTPSTGLLMASNAQGAPGSDVDITVSIAGNPGIVTAGVELAWDASKVELIGFTNGTVLSGSNVSVTCSPTYIINPYSVLWISTSTVNHMSDGVLGTFRFHIKDNAPTTGVPIVLSYIPTNMLNVDLQQVPFNVVNGSITITESPVVTHTVTFIDGYSFEVITQTNVVHGQNASFPQPPTHEGHTFANWSGDGTNIVADTSITAYYTRNLYTVTFVDNVTDEVLKTELVYYGDSATAPMPPTHAGYLFMCWDVDFGFVSRNLTVTALYMETGGGGGEDDLSPGDANGDGTVNTGDAVAVLRYSVDLMTLTDRQLAAADVNGDGKVNTGDAVGILIMCVS